MNLQLFKKIIETNSIYPNENDLGEFLYLYLNDLGFNVKKQYLSEKYCENYQDRNRFNLLAEKGEGDKALLLYAHMDTVPIHDKALWKTNPLEFVQDMEKENIYYGLGVVDMKGGLFSILEAIKGIDINGFKLKVVFGVDEEYWSKGAYTLIEDNFLDDVKLAMVPELGNPEFIQEGFQNIIIGRRGRFIIKLEVPGKSCHGANAPEYGINAITQASIIAKEIDEKYQITKVYNDKMIGNQFVKYINSTVSSLSVPDLAVMYIDRHIVPGENEVSVVSDIQNIIDNLYSEGKLKLIGNQKVIISLFERPTPASKAYIVDDNSPFLELIKKSVLKFYSNYDFVYGYSVADENVIANYKNIPVITLGPVGGNEHGANEWVDINSIEKLINIYREIVVSFGDF